MGRILVVSATLLIACGRGPEGTVAGDCNDHKDNDRNGKTDCDDEGCLSQDDCLYVALEHRGVGSKDRDTGVHSPEPERNGVARAKEPPAEEAVFFVLDSLKKSINGYSCSLARADSVRNGMRDINNVSSSKDL